MPMPMPVSGLRRTGSPSVTVAADQDSCFFRSMALEFKQIESKFETLGARVRCRTVKRNEWFGRPGRFVIDIRSDRRGEFFDIWASEDADVLVLDVQPRDRHLLMMVRHPTERPGLPGTKEKLLCGHDERHWFVASVPATAPVGTVVAAKEALKPELVRDLESGMKGKRKRRQRRKTETFVRQGEWFFIPEPDLIADPNSVLRNEPIRRGSGKPHHCEFLYRVNGTIVYVSRYYPNGLTETERRALIISRPGTARYGWQAMLRDPTVYVRGCITHRDHASIHLEGWHRVLMNTERQWGTPMRASSQRTPTFQTSLAFLD